MFSPKAIPMLINHVCCLVKAYKNSQRINFYSVEKGGVELNDNELVEKFENCALAGADFNHRIHVRLAWIYLHEFKPLDALARFSENLKKYDGSLGKSNLYH